MERGDEYTCERCHGVFERTRSDDEALEEARGIWGPVIDDGDVAVICDDCFHEFSAWAKEQGLRS